MSGKMNRKLLLLCLKKRVDIRSQSCWQQAMEGIAAVWKNCWSLGIKLSSIFRASRNPMTVWHALWLWHGVVLKNKKLPCGVGHCITTVCLRLMGIPCEIFGTVSLRGFLIRNGRMEDASYEEWGWSVQAKTERSVCCWPLRRRLALSWQIKQWRMRLWMPGCLGGINY